MKIAIVENNTVTNVITGDENFAKALKKEYHIIKQGESVGIGHTKNTDGTFTAPTPEVKIDLAQLKEEKVGALNDLEKEMRSLLTENIIFATLEGNTEAAKGVLAAAKQAKAVALQEIEALVEAKDAQGLAAYVVRGPKAEQLLDAIKNLAT